MTAKVSGEVDRIIIANDRSHTEIMQQLKEEAIDLALSNGALPGHVRVTEMDLIPVQYTSNNAVRAIVKAVSSVEFIFIY